MRAAVARLKSCGPGLPKSEKVGRYSLQGGMLEGKPEGRLTRNPTPVELFECQLTAFFAFGNDEFR